SVPMEKLDEIAVVGQGLPGQRGPLSRYRWRRQQTVDVVEMVRQNNRLRFKPHAIALEHRPFLPRIESAFCQRKHSRRRRNPPGECTLQPRTEQIVGLSDAPSKSK